MNAPIRVTVWGENFHENSERDRAGMAERYPDGMHGAIAAGIRELLGDPLRSGPQPWTSRSTASRTSLTAPTC